MRYRFLRFPGGKAKAVYTPQRYPRVYNPTARDIWFEVNGTLYEVKSGQEIQVK